MNIIITGAYGFLGSHVVRQCAKFGFTPIVLERSESNKAKLENLDFISLQYHNLDDNNLIESLNEYNPEGFIHIAWKGIDNLSRNNQDQITYNLPFAIKTIELANAVGCRQWIGIGSLSEYGKTTERVNENHCPHPLSLYAKSKLAACWASSALCQSFNMKWAWIRIGSIFGPGDADHWLIPYVINSLLKGIAPKLTPSEQIWDYLYVDDAAEAILNVMQIQAEGIFNLGSGVEITIKELIELIISKLQFSPKPQFGALPYSPEQIMYMVADISKITKVTKWKPAVTLSQGIENTVSFLSKRLSN